MNHPDQEYAPDFDEYGRDVNRPLNEEEATALARLDAGQGLVVPNDAPNDLVHDVHREEAHGKGHRRPLDDAP